ncbi:MAG: arginine--tRNA ligase [Pseudomonadota bacterium]|nr:arginine--tRNA ligase [Pseudomonadota bacterium]
MKLIDLLNNSLFDSIKNAYSLEKEDFQKLDLGFVASTSEDHGDYSSSASLKLAKKLDSSPRDIAKKISDGLLSELIEEISVDGPGFINICLTRSAKVNELKNAIELKEQWAFKKNNRKKALVEFVSSNQTGPLHVGHGRGAVLGIAISNLLQSQGYQVDKEYYVNDAGRQINILALSIILETINHSFNRDGLYQGGYINDLAKKFTKKTNLKEVAQPEMSLSDDADQKLDELIAFYQSESPKIWNELRTFAINEMIDIIKADLKNMGIIHDKWFYESSVGDFNDESSVLFQAVKGITKKKLTFKKDGALWFKSTDFGDDKDRVLLRENGEPTYYLTDVGYHKDKIDRKYEHYINIFGADHHGYVKRITSAFDTLKNDYQSLEIILYQLVNLFENGKKKQMSTRKGDFFSLEELREEIGSDVIKFFFLEKKSDHTIDFDVLKAKEESKTNPYFYTQYAHVRCCSILQNKAPDFKCMYDEKEITKNFDLLNKIINYPKHLEDFANERSPHSLVHFLKELAADFHSFYETNPVLVENDTVANSRLIITKATQIVLQNGLELLSVKPLSKM